jgi:hypothetical protein
MLARLSEAKKAYSEGPSDCGRRFPYVKRMNGKV